MRKLATFLIIPAVAIFLHACNTMEGAGEDISAGGDALSDTAADAKG